MNTKSWQVRCSYDLLDRVSEEAARRGLRMGEFVRFLMLQAVEQSEKGKPDPVPAGGDQT